jgi:NAD(P)H-dependent flavin oxidoreductase YrpB (nitropropane dioxygenase family)
VQMPVKRVASQRASRGDPSSGDSSSRDDDFVIAPHPRRATRKATQCGDVSSSQADEEAANVAEGQAVRDAREAKASDIIQKVERPLRTDYEYTLRRVDRRHPSQAYGFHKGRESIYNQ